MNKGCRNCGKRGCYEMTCSDWVPRSKTKESRPTVRAKRPVQQRHAARAKAKPCPKLTKALDKIMGTASA